MYQKEICHDGNRIAWWANYGSRFGKVINIQFNKLIISTKQQVMEATQIQDSSVSNSIPQEIVCLLISISLVAARLGNTRSGRPRGTLHHITITHHSEVFSTLFNSSSCSILIVLFLTLKYNNKELNIPTSVSWIKHHY